MMSLVTTVTCEEPLGIEIGIGIGICCLAWLVILGL